jgi:hypothetical protein
MAMTLDDAREALARDDGPGVIYRPAYGPAEEGTITSVNESYVFARFGSGRTSAACSPADLTLLAGKVPGDG